MHSSRRGLLAVLALTPLLALVPLAVASAAPAPGVVVNEVESQGGTPGDWAELANPTTAPVDVSGWVIKDDDDTHSFVIAPATTIAAGGQQAFDTDPSFGFGAADSVRLFTADGTLVDSYTWTAHATTTYGRCPSGTGAFTTTATPTKGTANSCGATTPPPTTTPPTVPLGAPWPGGAAVSTVDTANVLGGNVSGLAYEASGTSAPGVLWAVKNGPSTLYRLLWDGTRWTPDTANGWGAGKALHYPDGTGDPDTEGVTLVAGTSAGGVYASTERNNANNGVSRPEVLRFDVSGSATSLSATTEWNLTADLPAVGPNLGLEAVTWISDDVLVRKGFRDEATGALYDPTTYPDHAGGIFFTGLEANGSIYAYALDRPTGRYTRVATIVSGFPAVMDLTYEPESGQLWVVCDDTCHGRTSTFDVGTGGRFAVTATQERPAGMPDLNNEGFTITPQAECVGGLKPVFWADDTNDDGHALRAGTLRCTALPAPGTTTTAPGTTAPGAGGGAGGGAVTPVGAAVPVPTPSTTSAPTTAATTTAVPTAASTPGSGAAAADLASTGVDAAEQAGLGAAVLAAGTALLVLGRRRRTGPRS